MSTSAVEIRQHRRPEVRAHEPRERLETLEHDESLERSAPFSHRDGTVQRVKRRGRESLKKRVAFDDSVPPYSFERRHQAMLGSNARLGMVTRKNIALGRSTQPRKSRLNFSLVPKRAVLLFEQ